jgi:hypothetical protein
MAVFVEQSPLTDLIQSRMRALGLDAVALGQRLGIMNPERARGRLVALLSGTLDSRRSQRALGGLGAALEVPQELVDDAITRTREQRSRAHQEAIAVFDRAIRASFVPHAVLITALRRPTSITICGISGGPQRSLVVRLDPTQPASAWPSQVIAALPQRARPNESGALVVPFFGALRGFVINMTPDHAVEYDLDGHVVGTRPRSVHVGDCFVSL